jgi:arsenate reductase
MSAPQRSVPVRTILFVCVENTFRSVLSEELFNSKAPLGWHAESAGVSPATAVNPNVRQLLREVGIVLTERTPRVVTQDMVTRASRVVTFGCLDRCPIGAEGKGEDWPLPGATGKTFEELRGIRDELSRRVDDLIKKYCPSAEETNGRTQGGHMETPEVESLRQELLRAAKAHGTLTYGELMKLMGISRGRPLFEAIVAVDRAEYARGAPGFAAIIVRKDTGFPGGGFFCDDDLPPSLRRPFSRASDPKLSAAELNYVKEAQKKIWAYYSNDPQT